jgi:hypothetical protein
MKKSGQIIELDPSKSYIMLVKRKSCLAKMLHSQGPKDLIKNGRILFVDGFAEFKIVENSDRITNIMEESHD